MKSYIKPTIKYIELRVEESLAGIGSVSRTDMTVNWLDQPTVSDNNWSSFWLRILRK